MFQRQDDGDDDDDDGVTLKTGSSNCEASSPLQRCCCAVLLFTQPQNDTGYVSGSSIAAAALGINNHLRVQLCSVQWDSRRVHRVVWCTPRRCPCRPLHPPLYIKYLYIQNAMNIALGYRGVHHVSDTTSCCSSRIACY